MNKALLVDFGTGKAYLVDGKAAVGRRSGSDIVLTDETVSGHHADISFSGNTWYISDVGSKNGVEVDGRKLAPNVGVELKEGSIIKLGNASLCFTVQPDAIALFLDSQHNTGEKLNGFSKEKSFAPKSVPAPASKSGSKPVTKPAAKKKIKGSLIAVAAVLLLVLGFCLFNRLNGDAKINDGEYAAAMKYYDRDFLFSAGKFTEASILAGEDAFSKKNYSEAIKYFESAGESARTRWADAVYEQALVYLNSKDFDKSLEYLNKISDETRAQEQIGVATLEKAKQQYADGNTEEALKTAEGIKNTKYADVTAFFDTVYSETAKEYFLQGDYQSALADYQKCVENSAAKTNSEILTELIEKRYMEAAALADASIVGGSTDISRDEWAEAFDECIGSAIRDDINAVLTGEAAKMIVAGSSVFGSDGALERFIDEAPSGDMVGSYSKSSENEFLIGNLNELYDKCGKNPAGKILIIAQRHDYPDNEESQAVLLNMMRLLPKEYFPSTLDEVEYIILVDYKYIKNGSYENGLTVALRENAKVKVLRAKDRYQVYTSDTLNGDNSPDMIRYIIPPLWWSGGAPNMGKQIYNAAASVIK